MKNEIRFENPQPFTIENISEIEEKTGFVLSAEIKDFLTQNGGATIKFGNKDCFFKLTYEDGWESDDGLISVESFETILENWQYRNYVAEFQEHFKIEASYVGSEKLFPLFNTLAGGQVFIAVGGLNDRKIYHADNGDFGFCLLADSLNDFSDMCYGFSHE